MPAKAMPRSDTYHKSCNFWYLRSEDYGALVPVLGKLATIRGDTATKTDRQWCRGLLLALGDGRSSLICALRNLHGSPLAGGCGSGSPAWLCNLQCRCSGG